MNSIESLNSLVNKLSFEYSSRIREIVQQVENNIFNTQQLEEIKQIKIQLHLLFEARDNCLKIIKQIESS